MKIGKSVLCILLALAGGLLCQKIVTVNKMYPQLQIRQIPFGKNAEMQDGVTMRVEEVHWRTMDEAQAVYGQEFADQMEKGTAYRTMEAVVELENNSGQDQEIFLYDIYLEKGAYCQGIAPEVFYNVNDGPDMSLILHDNETRRAVLGYILYEFQFQPKQWENLTKLEFYLADTKYPVKTTWNVYTREHQ